jgi:hypothetical protein
MKERLRELNEKAKYDLSLCICRVLCAVTVFNVADYVHVHP